MVYTAFNQAPVLSGGTLCSKGAVFAGLEVFVMLDFMIAFVVDGSCARKDLVVRACVSIVLFVILKYVHIEQAILLARMGFR